MKMGGVDVPLIDGGVVANNPAACAIAEAVRLQVDADSTVEDLAGTIVVSMGTGETTRPISIGESQEWGAIEWAIPIIDVLFDGAADAVSYIAQHLIGEDRYHRLQTPLSQEYDEMDNADTDNLNALMVVADAYLQGGANDELKKIARQLQRTAEPGKKSPGKKKSGRKTAKKKTIGKAGKKPAKNPAKKPGKSGGAAAG